MNRTYETMVLLDNREVKKGWDALKSSVVGLFTKHESEIVSARRWAERELAFPVRNQLRGTYLLVYHNAPTGKLGGINRELEYSEAVLRHLTLACEEVPAEAHEPEEAFDESAVGVEEANKPAPAAEAAPAADADKKPAEAKADPDKAEGDADKGETAADEKAEEKSDEAESTDDSEEKSE